MKVSFLILAIFLSFSAFCQNLPIDSASHKITYTEVVDIPDAKKDQLYSLAKEWFARTYNSSQKVLQVQDLEAGKLIGKALSKSTLKGYDAGYVKYTISVFVKDGKYKYEITDLAHEKGSSTLGSGGALENSKAGTMSIMGKQWASIKTQADDQMRTLVSSLELAMKQKAKEDF